MPALDGAVPGTEVDDVAVGVGEDLHLDMTGPGKVLLEIALGPPEALFRFSLRGLQGVRRVGGRGDHPHAPATAPEGSFDGHGPTEGVTELDHFPGPDSGAPVPGTGATPAFVAAARLLILSPMISMTPGGGPTHTAPASMTAWAKTAFSARNP